jgi:hypothetical protein
MMIASMMMLQSPIFSARDNKTLDSRNCAGTIRYWLRYVYFVHDPLSNLDSFLPSLSLTRLRCWSSLSSGVVKREKDINLIQIHYISLHILAKLTSELCLIEAFCCCWCSAEATTKLKWMLWKSSQRSLKWFIIDNSSLVELFRCSMVTRWLRNSFDESSIVTALLVVHFAISSYLISRKCKNLSLPFFPCLRARLICFATKGKNCSRYSSSGILIN